MGILDSKSRILDAILTSEGRRQMAQGTFSVSYATFTDGDVFYEADAVEGHVDPTDRIYFEAASLPQDQIVFESNDAGNLVGLSDKSKFTFEKLDSIALLPQPLEILLSDGTPSAYQLNFGSKLEIRKPGIDPLISGNILKNLVFGGAGVGFSITDSAGAKADFILDPSKFFGIVSSSYARSNILSSSYYVGIKGGANAKDLTTQIQSVIQSASLLVGPTTPGSKAPGPHVDAVDRDNLIYLTDVSGSHDKIVVNRLLGAGPYALNLSTQIYPFVIEEALAGGRKDRIELTSADFSSFIDGILTSSFDNIKKQTLLSTIDTIFQEDKFEIFPQEIAFDTNQIKSSDRKTLLEQTPTLNSVPSLFRDIRVLNSVNFKYLPPIVKTRDADLPNKSDPNITLPLQLNKNFKQLVDLGFTSQEASNQIVTKFNYENLLKDLDLGAIKQNIKFDRTSRNNNLLCQIFEVSSKKVKKLDIIDHGYVDQGAGSILKKRVYFVGKVFLDDRGTLCFLNIFTLIFSQSTEEV